MEISRPVPSISGYDRWAVKANDLYYDGSRFAEVAAGIGYANGINASPDGRTNYVCALTEGLLHVYDRDPASGRLTLRNKVLLGAGGDNVKVDTRRGDLWIGAHSKLPTFFKYSKACGPWRLRRCSA